MQHLAHFVLDGGLLRNQGVFISYASGQTTGGVWTTVSASELVRGSPVTISSHSSIISGGKDPTISSASFNRPLADASW